MIGFHMLPTAPWLTKIKRNHLPKSNLLCVFHSLVSHFSMLQRFLSSLLHSVGGCLKNTICNYQHSFEVTKCGPLGKNDRKTAMTSREGNASPREN